MNLRRIISLCTLLILASGMQGCASIQYYTQAFVGQSSLMWKREQIDTVLADEGLAPEQRRKLLLVQRILKFAEDEMSLPVGSSYSTYVATKRPYLVWNVFTAPEFSTSLKTFCYPIAGCVSYRGYFSEQSAMNFARQQRARGEDVYVGGVAAYSTLGWFSDPILDTFLTRSDVRLAALIFHELAHKVLYIPGDTQFNESFASAVEQAALKRWLANKPEQLKRTDAERQRINQVLSLLANVRAELSEVYASNLEDSEKRTRKNAVIVRLRNDYQALKLSWNGHQNFSKWMSEDINNAKLAAIGQYHNWVPAFKSMLKESDENMDLFYTRAIQLAKLGRAARDNFLKQQSPALLSE